MLQNRIELFKQKIERQEASLAVANEIQVKHSEAVCSQAQLFLLGQAMRDAMQDCDIHMDQMSSTIDWLEQIIESCHADTVRRCEVDHAVGRRESSSADLFVFAWAASPTT